MKIALISDIHGNLEAFIDVLREIKKGKIRKMFCLGDIVDYGANSNECIDLMRKNKIASVQGNHDLNAVTLERLEWFNELAQISVKITNKLLKEKNKKFLLKLPKIIQYKNMFLVHGSPRDHLYDYIYPDTPDYIFEEFFRIINPGSPSFRMAKKLKPLSMTKKQIIIMGHTHIPFIKRLGNKLIINPGSVGQPRDGNNKASFCILESKKLKAEIVRISYDIEKAAQKILKAGMPRFLAERLSQGV